MKKTQTGRPAKALQPGTEVPVTVLVPSELKLRLQDAASASKRTLSAESHHRLERSFEPETLFLDAVNLLGAHRNPLGARAYVRTMLHAVYNADDAETAMMMLDALALLRATSGSTTKVTVPRANLSAIKAAVAKIEAEATIGDRKP
jgi:hypothetical protein